MKYVIATISLLFLLLATPAVAKPSHETIERVMKSIVVVTTTIGEDLGEFSGPAPAGSLRGALGSGFVLENGDIITNHHVIDNASEIRIRFNEKRHKWYMARVVASDPIIDVAILRPIDRIPEVQGLAWADHTKVFQGDDVWAAGSPLGLPFSFTMGTVSSINRTLNNPWQRTIQTDTAINSGNSGGPLLTDHGEVLGINTFILNTGVGGGSMGLNFAVRSDWVRSAINKLNKDQKIDRPFMGLQLTGDEEFVRITGVVSGAPGGMAGVRVDDQVLKFDDKEVFSLNTIYDILRNAKPGDIKPLAINRRGRFLVFDIELGLLNTN